MSTASVDFLVTPRYQGNDLLYSGQVIGIAGVDQNGNNRVATVEQHGRFNYTYTHDRRLYQLMSEVLVELIELRKAVERKG